MASRHPDRKARINEFAVIDSALNANLDRVAGLAGMVANTVRRLRLRTRGVKPFTKPPRGGVGDFPNLHHVKFWLDDIQKKEKTTKYKDDVEFLKKLHVTLQKRLK